MTHPRSQALAVIALVAALTLVAVLGAQNRSLRKQYERLKLRASAPYAGLSMPSFDATTSSGDSVRIGAGAEGERQLLLFFAATCPISRKTIPAWNEIVASTGGHNQLRVFGIQLDTAELDLSGTDATHMDFPVVSLPDTRLQQWYRIGGVPVTVVLNHEGRVLFSRLGEISERQTIDSVLAAVRNQAPWDARL